MYVPRMKKCRFDFYLLISFFVLFFLNGVAQNKFIFVSDTQEPMLVEKIFIKSSNNSQATDAILNSILKTPGLSEVFHLGDLTALGSLEGEWKKIDNFVFNLNQKNIKLSPVMGNHEYYIFPGKGKKQFAKRFSLEKTRWYVVVKENIAVILLNSNFSKLEDFEKLEQENWLKTKVEEFNNNPGITTIIMCTHHSPYTNSRVVTPSEEVQINFLPVFFNCPKCKLFISGHAHVFEHFQVKNKDFLVIGGGGGLLQSILTREKKRFDDRYPNQFGMGFFHYIECINNGKGLSLTVKKLNNDYKSFSDVYNITLEGN